MADTREKQACNYPNKHSKAGSGSLCFRGTSHCYLLLLAIATFCYYSGSMTKAVRGSKPKDPEMERVGRTLHTLRERYGYTQEAFGTELGISRSYISLIESGHKHLPDRLLSRCADLLEITPLAIKRPDNEEVAA